MLDPRALNPKAPKQNKFCSWLCGRCRFSVVNFKVEVGLSDQILNLPVTQQGILSPSILRSTHSLRKFVFNAIFLVITALLKSKNLGFR